MLERRLARLVEIRAPEIFIEDLRAKVRAAQRDGLEDRVSFRSPAGRTAADFVAVTVAAASYALATDAALVDPQLGRTLRRATLLKDLPERLAAGVREHRENLGAKFDAWGE
jgi:hypothetical protein